MFGAFPIVFQIERGWTPGQGGLAFIGVGVGMTLGVALNIWENGRYSVKLEHAGGRLPPEARLPMCALGGVLIPIGLFAFAWTATPSVHWIAPIICLSPLSFFSPTLVFPINEGDSDGPVWNGNVTRVSLPHQLSNRFLPHVRRLGARRERSSPFHIRCRLVRPLPPSNKPH